MENIDWYNLDFLTRIPAALAAFSLVTAAVLLVRRPCHRWLGARNAMWIWVLPPLMLALPQLPHLAGTPLGSLPSLAYLLSGSPVSGSAHSTVATRESWRDFLMAIWLVGLAVGLALAMIAQARFRRRLRGCAKTDLSVSGLPVWMAADPDTGPALVGSWRARIVVPADFFRRFDAPEQALVLHHEAMHARRRDGLANLAALAVALLLWFHPLAWWAVRAFRHDQELACDAAVLDAYSTAPHRYATALLKAHPQRHLLPASCGWSGFHPLTERIAMLNHRPSPRRRRFGSALGIVLSSLIAAVAYAATTPPPAASSGPAAAGTYQLDIHLTIASDDHRAAHAAHAQLRMCLREGQPGTVSVGDESIEAQVESMKRDQLDMNFSIAKGDKPASRKRVHAQLGQPTHVAWQQPAAGLSYAIDVTPSRGCAEAGASIKSPLPHSQMLVTVHVAQKQPAAVANDIADSAGWILVNPQVLTKNPVSLDFQEVPAERAMRLVADICGMSVRHEGTRIFFDPKPRDR